MLASLTQPGTPTVVLGAVMTGVCLAQIGIKVAVAHGMDRPDNGKASPEEQKHRKTAAIWLLPAAFYVATIVTVLAFDRVSGDAPKYDLNTGLAVACATLALGCLVVTWHVLWGRHQYKWSHVASMAFGAAAHLTMSFELWLFADGAHHYPLADSVAHFRIWTFGAAVVLAITALVLAAVARFGASDGPVGVNIEG